MEEAIKVNWSVRQLERQIATCSYSRVIANNSEVQKIDNVDEGTILTKYEPNPNSIKWLDELKAKKTKFSLEKPLRNHHHHK